MIQGYRNCSRCSSWRPVSDFTSHTWEGGRAKYIQPHCRLCHKQAEQRRQALWTPDQRLKRQEWDRIYRTKRRRAKGIAPRWPEPPPLLYIPAQPLQHWLQAQDEDLGTIASRIGVDERSLRRIVKGYSRKVRIETADRISVLGAGDPTLLNKTYAENAQIPTFRLTALLLP